MMDKRLDEQEKVSNKQLIESLQSQAHKEKKMRRVTAKDLDRASSRRARRPSNRQGLFTSRGTRTRGKSVADAQPYTEPDIEAGVTPARVTVAVAPRSIRRRLLKRRRFLPQSG